MSYYGDGRVSSDFCGLAREKRARDEPGVFQVYFTGCAGNVTAGKYNDGAKENRPVLRDRMQNDANSYVRQRSATALGELTAAEPDAVSSPRLLGSPRP